MSSFFSARGSVKKKAGSEKATSKQEAMEPKPKPIALADSIAAVKVTREDSRYEEDHIPNIDDKVSNILIRESILTFANPEIKIKINVEKFHKAEVSDREKLKFQIDSSSDSSSKKSKQTSEAHKSLADVFSIGKHDGSESVSVKNRDPGTHNIADNLNNGDINLSPENLVTPAYINRIHGKHISDELAQLKEQAIKSDPFFWKYRPDYRYPGSLENSLCQRTSVKMWSAPKRSRYLISCGDLCFSGFDQIEPLFCSVCLFDYQLGCQVSENFYFDHNPEDLLPQYILDKQSLAHPVNQTKHAIFEMEEPSDKIVLLLRVERILPGDPDILNDFYLKEKRTKKDFNKTLTSKQGSLLRLAKYRQPFLWGVQGLFDANGSLCHQEDAEIKLDKLFLTKEPLDGVQLSKLILELMEKPEEESSLKKKLVPCVSFHFFAQELDNDMSPCKVYDPSGNAVLDPCEENQVDLPVFSHSEKRPTEAVSEIEYFYKSSNYPFSDFVHLMYIYPGNVSFSKYRNILVKAQFLSAENSDAAQVFFGKGTDQLFVSERYSQVSYHVYSPSFNDEFKLKLPIEIGLKSHILFTFYNINCKQKSGKDTEHVIGYSALPLYPQKQLLKDGVHQLPISTNLSENYLAKFAGKFGLEFIDKAEAKFSLTIRKDSTIISDDTAFTIFFDMYPRVADMKDDAHIIGLFNYIIGSWNQALPQSFVNFMTPTLNFLLKQIGTSKSPVVRSNLFKLANILLENVRIYLNESSFRTSYTAAYIEHLAHDLGILDLYQTIMREFQLSLQESSRPDSSTSNPRELNQKDFVISSVPTLGELSLPGKIKEPNTAMLTVCNSWFWFELISKLGMYRQKKAGNLDNHGLANQFFLSFRSVIESIVLLMFAHRSGIGQTILRNLNCSLALFISDLFRVVDRSILFNMIKDYIEHLDTSSDTVLVQFKIHFLSIIQDNSNYLDILQPLFLSHFLGKANLSQSGTLIQILTSKFPLVETIVRFVGEHLFDPSTKSIHSSIINCLRNPLIRIDFDATVDDDVRRAFASTYIVLIPTLCENVQSISRLPEVQHKNLLACFVWVLRHADTTLITRWVLDVLGDSHTLSSFMKLCQMSIDCFEYVGISHHRTADEFSSILSPETAASFMNEGDDEELDYKNNIEIIMSGFMNRNMSLRKNQSMDSRMRNQSGMGNSLVPPSRKGGSVLRSSTVGRSASSGRKSEAGSGNFSNSRKLYLQQRQAIISQNSLKKAKRRSGVGSESISMTVNDDDLLLQLVYWEGSLNATVSWSILGVLGAILKVFENSTLQDYISLEIWKEILQVLVALLTCNQCDGIFSITYQALRFFLTIAQKANSNARFLFVSSGTIFQLSQLILGHCTLPSEQLRGSAVSILYLIGKTTFIINKHFDPFLEAITFSLTDNIERLKGKGAGRFDQSLKAVLLYKESDADVSRRGDGKFEEVIRKVSNIFQDTLKIISVEKLGTLADSCILEDLYLNMARSYDHLPEVKMQWLNRLADHNYREENFAEAAQCLLEIARLTEKFLGESDRTLPTESQLKLLSIYERVVKSFDMAFLYEECDQIYAHKVLPKYFSMKLYGKMTTSYKHLAEVSEKLVAAEESKYRMLGTYYRIGFFGTSFGDLNGRQFIYKRPKITQLAEVVSFIKEKYASMVGDSSIKILTDSGNVEQKNLNPEDCNVQITFVQPYFDDHELVSRRSFIERNHRVRRFTFSIPFSKDGGKAQSSDITKQCTLVNVLSVAEEFPSTRTRQEISKVEQIVLGPALSAAANVKRRVEQFNNVLSAEEIPKQTLLSLLQGSILLQVHGGVTEICKAFFVDEIVLTVEPQELDQLRDAIVSFIKVCELGLEAFNRIATDALDSKLRIELEKQFANLRSEISHVLKKYPKSKPQKSRSVRFAEDTLS